MVCLAMKRELCGNHKRSGHCKRGALLTTEKLGREVNAAMIRKSGELPFYLCDTFLD